MKRKIFLLSLVPIVLLGLGGCAGSPAAADRGNLIVQNQSGIDLAIYVDKLYKETVKTGGRYNILVDYAEDVGTIVEVECFYRDKLSGVESYPADENAKYYSFPKTVRPLSSPEPVVPIYIRQLSAEELANNAGLNSVLVKFSYNDYPRVDSAVSVFTGSTVNQNPIVRLQNGETMFAPMPVGLTPIATEYVVGGKNIQRKAYPQNANQRNDERFLVYVQEGVTEAEHVVPLISDIFNVTYVSNNPAARGTLRVRNDSSQQINIRAASGTAPERPISGADSVVLRNRRRDFPIDSGAYIIRAVDALDGGYKEIASLEDISVEPGMVYYWFVRDANSTLDTRVNLAVSQQIKNWFQTWTIDSMADARVSLQVKSTTSEITNSRRELGITGRDGQLILRDLDIENLIRGLTTDNARRVALTVTVEKEGYDTASQSISAFSLLAAGTEFKPEYFTLTKKETSMEDSELIIGEPRIP